MTAETGTLYICDSPACKEQKLSPRSEHYFHGEQQIPPEGWYIVTKSDGNPATYPEQYHFHSIQCLLEKMARVRGTGVKNPSAEKPSELVRVQNELNRIAAIDRLEQEKEKLKREGE